MTTSLAPQQNGAAAESFADSFGKGSRKNAPPATVEIESQRAIAETQAAMVIAQRFPRNTPEAVDRIMQAFARPTLAQKALYSYARGGTDITGPSIRAAEAIAQEWGNIQSGVRELEQRNGMSIVEAFAWDVQTNHRSSKTFQVPHVRHTRSGQTRLEDPRDIYEAVANQGARRLRACILAVIPSDVVEAAIDQAETTLRTRVQITPELIQSLVEKFASVEVSRRMLETKIQRRLESITPAQVVQLGKIFNAIEDGIASVSDHFQVEETPADATKPANRVDAVAQKLEKKNAGKDQAATSAPQDAGDAKGASAPAPAAEAAEQPDEKQKGRELRTAILNVWNGHDIPRAASLKRLYAKSALPELNVAQLEDFLAQTPELMKQAGIAPVEAPAAE